MILIQNMKLKYLITLLFLACSFTNCSKNETGIPSTENEEQINPEANPDTEEEESPIEPEKEVYFEATIGTYLNTEIGDHWLIIHDEQGELMDYKSFEGGETVVFETTKDSLVDSFTVTYFYVYTLTGRAPFTINSYTNVAKGSSWKIGTTDPTQNNSTPNEIVTGSFDLKISGDFLAPSMQVISNSDSNGKGNGAYSISSNTNTGDWVYEKSAELFDNNDYYITLMNGFGETKYYYLQNVQNQETFNLDYLFFSSFDSSISMTLPETANIFFHLRGHPEEATAFSSRGYDFYSMLNLKVGTDVAPNFDLGYFGNRFAGYSFLLTCSLEDYTYNYNYYGKELPSALNIPERPSLEIVNSNIFDFAISTDLNYIRRRSGWAYAEDSVDPEMQSTYWTVSAPFDSSSTIGVLPEEISNAYPDMKVSEMEYRQSVFFTNSGTYDEFIETIYGGANNQTAPRTEEYLKISF